MTSRAQDGANAAQYGFTELVGVYDADGGLLGEARYVIGHLLGQTECALCDITHSPVRRKPAWDAMVRRTGVPWRVVHRNEQTDDVAVVTSSCGLPAVIGRRGDGQWQPLLDRAALSRCGGSVEGFEKALGEAMRASTDPVTE